MSKEFDKSLKYLMKNPEGSPSELLAKIGVDMYDCFQRNGFIESSKYNSFYKSTELAEKEYQSAIIQKSFSGKIRFAFR